MFNNLKREIEKDFNKENNYKAILSKVEGVSSMKKFKIKYALLPICVIIFAIIVFRQSDLFKQKVLIGFYKSSLSNQNTMQNNNEDSRWIIKEIHVDSNSGKEGEMLNIIPHWDEMSITEQFHFVEYNDNNYDGGKAVIPDDMIGENLGTTVLTGQDTYTDAVYSKDANLYAINTISKECAIAVQFENTSEYYSYVNYLYRPDTLEQFIEDLNLKENVSFGTIYYNYFETDKDGKKQYVQVEFPNVSDDVIWKILFSDTSLKNEHSDLERHNDIMGISVDIPLLGIENISISVNEEGYLETNILATGKCFYIGEDRVQEFVSYIIENYEGYKIVYVDEESNTNSDDIQQITEVENVVYIP